MTSYWSCGSDRLEPHWFAEVIDEVRRRDDDLQRSDDDVGEVSDDMRRSDPPHHVKGAALECQSRIASAKRSITYSDRRGSEMPEPHWFHRRDRCIPAKGSMNRSRVRGRSSPQTSNM